MCKILMQLQVSSCTNYHWPLLTNNNIAGNINTNSNSNNNSEAKQTAAVAVGQQQQQLQQQQSPSDIEVLMIPTSNLQKFIENADKILKNMTANSSSSPNSNINTVAAAAVPAAPSAVASSPSEQRTGWLINNERGMLACFVQINNNIEQKLSPRYLCVCDAELTLSV